MTFTINPSKLSAFIRCKLKYAFGRWEIPAPPVESITLGSAVHTLLQEYYEKGIWNLDAIKDTEFDLSWFISQYVSKANIGKVISVERKLEYPLSEDLTLNGRIDLTIKDMADKIWVVDHKTTRKSPVAITYAMSLQGIFYVWLSRQLGESVDGAMYNVLVLDTARKKLEVQRYWLLYSQEQLDAFQAELMEWIKEVLEVEQKYILPKQLPRRTALYTCHEECPWLEYCNKIYPW